MPEGVPNSKNYFLNDFQSIKAVDGLYSRAHQEQMFGRNIYWEQGAANDVVWGRTGSGSSLCTFQYTGDEGRLTSFWEYSYEIMSRCNYVVQGLLNKKSHTELTPIEKRSLGEAYFMRAFYHFYIAYRYGTDKLGVPFIQWEKMEGEYDNSIPPQQASVMENYRLIIEDLQKAEEYLPRFETYGKDDQGRAHQAAAIGFQAKVYAYWATWDKSKWDNVIALVNKLETNYGRGLAPEFPDNFSSDFGKFWTKEYIYTFPSTGGSLGGGVKFPGVVLENKGWGKYNGWGQFKPTLDIYELMREDGEGNIRLTTSILEYGQEFQYFGEKMKFYSTSDLESGFQINKYMDAFKYPNATEEYVNPNGNFMTTRINFPILRFAELMLFRAEANLVKGNGVAAAKDINAIRRRSHLKEISGAATWANLYHERRAELAFEFTDHLFDLKRWERSDNAEIHELALKELNAKPRIRKYAERSKFDSTFTIETYGDYAPNKQPYQSYMMVFPYPSNVVVNSNGLLKQNEGYAK